MIIQPASPGQNFIAPPSPYDLHTLLDDECIIGTPILASNGQYELFTIDTINDDQVWVSHTLNSRFEGPLDITIYIVLVELNRTIEAYSFTIKNPPPKGEENIFQVSIKIDHSLKEKHKYLWHFHLKPDQQVEGYLHTLISSTQPRLHSRL